MRTTKIRIFAYWFFASVVIFIVSPTLKAVEGKKYAFLIGLKDYHKGVNRERNGGNSERFGQLPFTANDLSKVYKSLLGLGFEKENIRIYFDAKDLEEMAFSQEESVVINRIDNMQSHIVLKNLRDFIENDTNNIGRGDTLLVYLTGHGSVFNNLRYFAVRTTDPESEETYISIDKIVMNMSFAYGANKLLLVDACANKNLETNFGSRGDRTLINTVDIYQIFSSHIGQVSRFDPDPLIKMSVFSYYLVKAFQEADNKYQIGDHDNKVETDEIYDYVKDKVSAHPIPNYDNNTTNLIPSLQKKTLQIPDQLSKGGAFSIGYVFNECNSFKQKMNESSDEHSKRINYCISQYE